MPIMRAYRLQDVLTPDNQTILIGLTVRQHIELIDSL